ncbi:unnamed protein product [Symbiodinium sp. CCMP2592]|nr:unnamed protein product [Symbiodinium sp. CCMP2592]
MNQPRGAMPEVVSEWKLVVYVLLPPQVEDPFGGNAKLEWSLSFASGHPMGSYQGRKNYIEKWARRAKELEPEETKLKEIDQLLWDKTMEEVQSGYLSGDKLRPIDNYSSSLINEASRLNPVSAASGGWGAALMMKKTFRPVLRRDGFARYRGRIMQAHELQAQYRPAAQQTPSAKPTTSGASSQASAAIKLLTWNCGGFSTCKDEFYTWLKTCSCDAVCLQETWMRESSEFVAGEWTCVQSGVGTSVSRAQAGVMIMLKRSVFDSGTIRYNHVVAGRVLHVRAQSKHGWVDIVGTYMHAGGSRESDTEIVKKRSKVWTALRTTLGQIPRGSQLLLCGDFNTITKPTPPCIGAGTCDGEKEASLDSDDMLGILQDFGLQAVNTFGKHGSYTHVLEQRGKQYRSFLDYVMVRRRGATLRTASRIIGDCPVARWRGGGRHLPVAVTLHFRRFQFVKPRPQPSWPQWKCTLLTARIAQNGPDVQAFQAQVEHELNQVSVYTPEQVNSIILKAGQQNFSIERQSSLRPPWVFVRAFVLGGAIFAFSKCIKLWPATADFSGGTVSTNFFVGPRLLITSTVWINFSFLLRRHAPKQPRTRAQLRSSTGALLMPHAEAKALATYWKEVTTASVPSQAPEPLPFDIQQEAIQSALEALPANKAAPAHYAPHVLWSCAAPSVARVLERGLMQTWRQAAATVPVAWADAWLTFLQKPNKAGNAPQHLRPIALLDPVGKAVTGILRDQLDTYIIPHMVEQHQYGFLPHRSVQQALGHAFMHCRTVRSICQAQQRSLYEQKAGNKSLGLAGGMILSIDLTQAFDRVDRGLLEASLIHIGVPAELRHLLLQWVHAAHYVVQREGHTQRFGTTQGIRQGCRLSPSLWNCVVIYLTHLREQKFGSDWCRQHLVGYADDNLFKWTFRAKAEVTQAIAEAGDIVALFEGHGLQVSKDKTAILLRLAGSQAAALRSKITTKVEGKCHLMLGPDLTLPVKSQHVYLGAIISFARFEEYTAAHRRQAGIATYHRLRQHLHSKRAWPLHKRIRLWKAYILPTVFYALTASGLTAKSASMIRVELVKQLRAIAGSPRHLTLEPDAQFLEGLGLESPLQLLVRRQVRVLEKTRELQGKLPPHDVRLDPALFAHEESILQQFQNFVQPDSTTGAAADLPCPDCGKCFPTAASLRQHRASAHRRGEDKPSGERFDRLLHGKDGLPQCINCGHKFRLWEELQRHVELGRCQATAKAEYEDVHPPLLAKVLEDEIAFPEVFHQLPPPDLKTELNERCALCRTWLPNENYMKVHYGRVHRDEWQAHSGRVRVWCMNNLPPIKGICRWCGHKDQSGRDHRATCPALFQLAMTWFVNGGPPEAADVTDLVCLADISKQRFKTHMQRHHGELWRNMQPRVQLLCAEWTGSITIPCMMDTEIQDVFAGCLPALAKLSAVNFQDPLEIEATGDQEMPNRGKRSRQEPEMNKDKQPPKGGKGKGGRRDNDGRGRGHNSWGSWDYNHGWDANGWDANNWGAPHRHPRPNMEQLVEALCRLTLKQEEELQLIRTEKQFLLHLESGTHGLLAPLWQVAQAWKTGRDKTPPTVTSSLRVALIKSLLAEWVTRLDMMTKDEATIKKMEAQGWVKVQGEKELHWTFQQRNAESRRLELDATRPPIGHTQMVKIAHDLQQLVMTGKEELIHRFHSTRKLTETVTGDTLPFILSVAMRGTRAQQAHDLLRSLTGSAALRLVGVRIRGERMNLQPLAQHIAKMAAALRR